MVAWLYVVALVVVPTVCAVVLLVEHERQLREQERAVGLRDG